MTNATTFTAFGFYQNQSQQSAPERATLREALLDAVDIITATVDDSCYQVEIRAQDADFDTLAIWELTKVK